MFTFYGILHSLSRHTCVCEFVRNRFLEYAQNTVGNNKRLGRSTQLALSSDKIDHRSEGILKAIHNRCRSVSLEWRVLVMLCCAQCVAFIIVTVFSLAIIFIYSSVAIMAINIMIALWLFGCTNTISIAMECVTFDVINGVIVCHSVAALEIEWISCFVNNHRIRHCSQLDKVFGGRKLHKLKGVFSSSSSSSSVFFLRFIFFFCFHFRCVSLAPILRF